MDSENRLKYIKINPGKQPPRVENINPVEWFSGLSTGGNDLSLQESVIEPLNHTPSCEPSDCDEVTGKNAQNSTEIASVNMPNESTLALENSLSGIFASWIQKLRENPTTFEEPIKIFIKQNEKLDQSETGLVSAFHMFGKSGGHHAIGYKKNRCHIPVQPTSKARRTTYLGGRNAQFTGRPGKAFNSMGLAPDHNYDQSSTVCKDHSQPAWATIPKRSKVPAPHSLSKCVDAVRSIGTNHSKK